MSQSWIIKNNGSERPAIHFVSAETMLDAVSAEDTSLQHFLPVAGGSEHGNHAFNLPQRDLHSPVQTACDLTFMVAVGLFSGSLYNLLFRGHLSVRLDQFWCALMIALLYVALERARTGDKGIALSGRRSRFSDVTKVWTLSFICLVFVNFTMHTSMELSRAYIGIFYLVGLLSFGSWRAFVAPTISRASRRVSTAQTDWVVIGDRSSPCLREVVEELGVNSISQPMMIPLDTRCNDDQWRREQQSALAAACHSLRTSHKGGIYLCSVGLTPQRLANLCDSLSILPVNTYVIPDNATLGLVGCKPIVVGRRIALELRRAPMGFVQLAAKRLMDIVLGCFFLVTFSPLFLLVAIAIRIDSRGPVFFRQNRSGKGGKPFRIFKFRSMYVMEDGPTIQQACRNDPRVTRVGRILRSTSIDELPQLLNVLSGEMSLVGPRPHAVAHDEHYVKFVHNYETRQHVKPGITGWAQVNGLRGETADVESMRLRIEADIWYALNANLLLDLEILARTAIEVVRSRDAY